MASQEYWNSTEEDSLENQKGRNSLRRKSRQEQWPEQGLGVERFTVGLGRRWKPISKVLSL